MTSYNLGTIYNYCSLMYGWNRYSPIYIDRLQRGGQTCFAWEPVSSRARYSKIGTPAVRSREESLKMAAIDLLPLHIYLPIAIVVLSCTSLELLTILDLAPCLRTRTKAFTTSSTTHPASTFIPLLSPFGIRNTTRPAGHHLTSHLCASFAILVVHRLEA